MFQAAILFLLFLWRVVTVGYNVLFMWMKYDAMMLQHGVVTMQSRCEDEAGGV